MSIALRPFLAIAAVLAFTTPISGQQPALADDALEPGIEVSETAVFVGFSGASSASTAPSMVSSFATATAAPVLQERRASSNVALMIVGGAGLVVGSLVDGDAGTIIMIGGGTVALIGLYRYLR